MINESIRHSIIELPDQNDRDRFENDTKNSIFVSAGAGSGKTTTLVKRCVKLILEQGVSIGEIVAISFTNASAEELRNKIRIGIETSIKDTNRAIASKALSEIDSASFLTIDSFANRTVKSFIHLTELSPTFEVADQTSNPEVFNNVWRTTLQEMPKTCAFNEFLDDLDAFDIKLSSIKHSISKCSLKAASPTESLIYRQLGEVDQISAICKESISKLETTKSLCSDDSDRLYDAIQHRLIPRLNAIVNHASIDSRYGVIRECLRPFKAGNLGSKANWPDKDGVKDLINEIEEQIAFWLDSLRHEIANFTEVLAGKVISQWRSALHERNIVTYDEVLSTFNVLLDNPDVRSDLWNRYRYIFIDEFQDTNKVQVDIAKKLSSKQYAPKSSNSDGRIVVVGDERQSIYRFRDANVALFSEFSKELKTHASLTTNFRTLPKVLTWINNFYERVFADANMNYVGLDVGRISDEVGEGTVTVFGDVDKSDSAMTARFHEADDVAKKISEIVGSLIVEDGTADMPVVRPAKFSDVAILIPRRTRLDVLRRALSLRGISTVFSGRSDAWQSDEVFDVIAILRAVTNPDDSIACVGALRTALLGCSDKDLIEFKQHDGVFSVFAQHGESNNQTVLSALETLRKLHRVSVWSTSLEMLEEIISTTEQPQSYAHTSRWRDCWNRTRLLLEHARDFDLNQSGSCSEFVKWIDNLQKQDTLSDIVPSIESDDDAVRIMTYHGSKGLEFPVVFALGLDSISSRVEVKTLSMQEDGRLQATGKALISGSKYDLLREQEALLALQEDVRLAYVGMTRARDHLFVSRWRSTPMKPSSKGVVSGSHLLMSALNDGPCLVGEPKLAAASVESGLTSSANRTDIAVPKMTHDFYKSLITKANTPDWFSATKLSASTDQYEVAANRYASDFDERYSSVDREVSIQIGVATHLALARIIEKGIASESDVSAAIDSAIEFSGAFEVSSTVHKSVRLALSSSTVQEALHANRFCELKVTSSAEGVAFGGFVDLVYQNDNGDYIVVDYKTEKLHSSKATLQAQHHALQLATYGLCLEQAIGKKVNQGVVVFCGADLDVAVEEKVQFSSEETLKRIKEFTQKMPSAKPPK